jgi:uncharacterized protein
MEIEIFNLIIIFCTSILAGVIGGAVGGGGNLLTIFVLMYFGLPLQNAIATSRFSDIGYALSAIYKFWKSKKIFTKFILPLALISLIGGIIGANLLIQINENLLSKIIAFVIILFLPLILIKKDLGIKNIPQSKNKLIFGFFLYFILAIYDGFFGAAGGGSGNLSICNNFRFYLY